MHTMSRCYVDVTNDAFYFPRHVSDKYLLQQYDWLAVHTHTSLLSSKQFHEYELTNPSTGGGTFFVLAQVAYSCFH